jgi:threonine-phosphate decarboxylase
MRSLLTVNNEDVSAIGINPLGPSKKVKAAIRRVVKDIKVSPDSYADKFLRFLSSRYGVREDEVLLANSLKELIYGIFHTLCPKNVLIMGPALPVYEEVARFSGAKISYFIADENNCFSMPEPVFSDQIHGAALVIIANPNRVTGRYMDREDINDLLSFFARQKITVVLDGSLIEFTENGIASDSIALNDGILIIRSTSCFHGLPGLELAYAISSPHTVAELQKDYHGTVNVLALEAARTAYKDKAYSRLSKQYLADERNLLVRALKKFNGLKVYDTDANMILVKSGAQSRDVINAMRKNGLRVLDCSIVRGLGADFLSIPVMKHEDNLACIRILNRIFSRAFQE